MMDGGKVPLNCLTIKMRKIMKNTLKTALFLLVSLVMASCYQEDPGPRQGDQKNFYVIDFDRLEIADAIDVTVTEGNSFSISARGDRRNLNDLKVYKDGSTLIAKFSENHNRQYTTYITITMPSLHGLDFSGAVNGHIEGFEETTRFDLSLSGASVAQMESDAIDIFMNLTGASQLRLTGKGQKVNASVSGASELVAFDFPIEEAHLMVSGASHARINASQKLSVTASGASDVLYRGSPQLDAEVSGASTLAKD